MVWNLFPFKGYLSFGKSQKLQGTKSGLWGMAGEAESPWWFDVLLKNSAWDVIHEQVPFRDEATNHQLSLTAAIFVLLHLSTNKELWGSTPFLLFGLEGHTQDGQHLPNEKTRLIWSWSCCDFATLLQAWRTQVTSIGSTGPSFPHPSRRPTIISCPSWGNLVHW